MRAKEGMEKNMPIGININYISASVLVETKQSIATSVPFNQSNTDCNIFS